LPGSLDHSISVGYFERRYAGNRAYWSNDMQANRFEQVSEVQPDAITLSLSRSASGEVGAVILPATASGGRLSEDKISGELPAIDSFRSAIKLANEMRLAIVVMDPEGVWKKEWGELYTPIDG
jgi:hypothetical protein